jgi:flagellar biosynthesis protein FlhG
MLPIHDLPTSEIDRIRVACAYLFSPEHSKDDHFLKQLKGERVKQAFREKAKRYHPDLHSHESPQMVEKRKERFVQIRASYETLSQYFCEKPAVSPGAQRVRRPILIAVGGAKGGIGKSVFSTNLGVLLSQMGNKTILVDLDLGGANLHLHLGETSIPQTINDFLSQRASNLKEIVVTTKYGPSLIGGDSSQLGIANIGFSLKLKLLRSIRMIDADYVVLDLGSGSSFNTIDFFLAADHGLVLTTCDPSAYLNAYTFIVVSVIRKLNRLFRSESNPVNEKDEEIIRLVEEATLSRNGNRVKTVSQLLERVKKEQPGHLASIKRTLEKFRPYLVANMVESESDAILMVERIEKAKKRMLSVDVGYLGALPYHPEIKSSTRELVPAVAKSPRGNLARFMGNLVRNLDLS